MQPKLIATPFAKNGQKNEIPEQRTAGLLPERATYTEGFPNVTMLPLAAGGLPPHGTDFNGVLNEITEHISYQNKGGRYKFDNGYAQRIGGYPKGSILQDEEGKYEYISLIDNNTINFNIDDDSAYWLKYADIDGLISKLGTAAYQNIGTENGEIPDMSKFTSGTGWVRFPNGFLIQGGLLTTESHGGKTIPFPVAFTNKPFFITVIPHGHGAYDSMIHVNAGDTLTNTYFQCYGYYQDANGFRKDAIAFSWSAAGF